MNDILIRLAAQGVQVTRLANDSRAVQPGDTFVAYPGAQQDGRNYIDQAIAAGANAVIWQPGSYVPPAQWSVPQVSVPDLRHQAGALADAVYDRPSRHLRVIGITGTNGKTSCSHWIAHSLAVAGQRSAVIGTLGNGFPGALEPTRNTTPDALQVHALLAHYRQAGAQAAAMEVSSHALAQGRVNGVHFDTALLTNLTRDHLDYHGDMQQYAASKRKLFEWETLRCVVLNLDDDFGQELARQLGERDIEIIAYGLTRPARALAERQGLRMVYGEHLTLHPQGMALDLRSSWGAARLETPLLGHFNAANLLGVLGVLLAGDMALDTAVGALGSLQPVAGRMQRVGGSAGPTVLVDYAHTPDALAKVLDAARELAQAQDGRVACVFGCGGDRDRGKRAMMGRVAEQHADLCIVTSDNPRSESPEHILAEIGSGMTGTGHRVIADRAEAIAHAVAELLPQDVLLIAGKGHETYQEIAGIRHPFDDAEVARRALSGWRAAA